MKKTLRQRSQRAVASDRPAGPAHRPEPPDATLLTDARAGDPEAYGELWRRHRQAIAALTYPLAFAETDDVVAEAFAAVWEQIQRGQGPAEHFRAYLVSVSRNIASRRYHESQRVLTDALPEGPPVPSSEEIIELRDENSDILAAFTALPVRWQQVLWWQDVDEQPRSEIAARLQLSPNSVSALARRAREGLRVEWLRQQIPRHLDSGHSDTVELLPKYVRHAVSRAQAETIGGHLAICSGCSGVERTLQQHNRRLGRTLGTGGALAFVLGGTLTTDFWATSLSASATTAASAQSGSNVWVGMGSPMSDVARRASRSLARGARRAADSLAGVTQGSGLATAGVAAAAATVTVGALAVGLSQYPFLQEEPVNAPVNAPVIEQSPAPAGGRTNGAQSDGTGTNDRVADPPLDDRVAVPGSPTSEAPASPDATLLSESAGLQGANLNALSAGDQPAPPDASPEPTDTPEVPAPTLPGKDPGVEPGTPAVPGKPTIPSKPAPGHPAEANRLTVTREDAAGTVVAPLLTGTGTPHATIRVTVSGQIIETVAAAAGSWTVDLASAELPAGPHTATVSQVIAGAPSGTAELLFTLEQPNATLSTRTPDRPDSGHHGSKLVEFAGIPMAEICVTAPWSEPHRVVLDADGHGELRVREYGLQRDVMFSYCVGDRLGVRGVVTVSHRR